MERRRLIEHLRRHGCRLDREGTRHSLYVNPVSGGKDSVPRHSEIDNRLARKICSHLGVPQIG